jgi:tetratricopeptide (TPR) repeat protein
MYKEWGYACLRLNQLDSAEWAWNRFKQLSPESSYHELNRRLLNEARFQQYMSVYNAHYRDNDYAFLKTILNKALEYKPDDAPAWINLGKVYYLNQQKDSAVFSWRQALKSDTANVEAANLLKLF